MNSIWVPFSYLKVGDLFEPLDVLYEYTPICTKVNATSGIGSTHMGPRMYLIPSETYVRICLAWYERGPR